MLQLLKYWPLFALILVAVLAAFALNLRSYGDPHSWAHYFMGFFFCQFAMLKLFNIPQFAEGFRMYDLVAQRLKFYSYLYPFIELALGLAYLSFIAPTWTYIATIFFMSLGSFGVFNALKKGLNVRCACMGTVLNVPLSTVTLSEDISMGAMALFMLFIH